MIPHQPQHGLPSLPPGFDPATMPKSTRFQRYEYDQSLGKAATLKALSCTILGIGIIAAWKFNDNGTSEVVNFLVRYGLTLIAALGIYTACCRGLIEYCGPLPRAILGVAGALAVSLLTQFVISQSPTVLALSFAWFFAFLVFLGAASSLLDLDIQEAALFAIFVLGVRFILKFAIFDTMFAK